MLAGQVRVGEGDAARLDRKAGDLVDAATPVALSERDPYVSRGGHKLAAALDAFEIDPAGRVCLDVGASTGGFTDVLLQRGARASMLSTWDGASSPSRSAATSGSSRWSGRTPERSAAGRCPSR